MWVPYNERIMYMWKILLFMYNTVFKISKYFPPIVNDGSNEENKVDDNRQEISANDCCQLSFVKISNFQTGNLNYIKKYIKTGHIL